MTMRIGTLVLLSMLCGVASAQKAATKDEDAIKAVVTDFAAAWGKHDPKAMAALYTDDATIINPWGRVAKGRAEVEKLFADEQVGPNAPLKDTPWTATVAMWRPAGPNAAFVDLDADLPGMKGPDGKPMSGKHHLAVLMTKKGTKWSISDARPYFLAPPPPAKPAAAPAKK